MATPSPSPAEIEPFEDYRRHFDLVGRFIEEFPGRLSHGERREMVDLGLAYRATDASGQYYCLTDLGRDIARHIRIGGAR